MTNYIYFFIFFSLIQFAKSIRVLTYQNYEEEIKKNDYILIEFCLRLNNNNFFICFNFK